MTAACRPSVGKGKGRTGDRAPTKPRALLLEGTPGSTELPIDAKNRKGRGCHSFPHLSSAPTGGLTHRTRTGSVLPTSPLGLPPKRWVEEAFREPLPPAQTWIPARPWSLGFSPQPRPRCSQARSLPIPSLSWLPTPPQEKHLLQGERMAQGFSHGNHSQEPGGNQVARTLGLWTHRQQDQQDQQDGGGPGPAVSRWEVPSTEANRC